MISANSYRFLAIAGLIVLVIAFLDPLEGFPLVLLGGLLLLIAARQEVSRLRLLAWGLGLAAVGCGVMVALSSVGGIGGTKGLAPAWGLLLIPYPVGGVVLLVGGILLLRSRAKHPG